MVAKYTVSRPLELNLPSSTMPAYGNGKVNTMTRDTNKGGHLRVQLEQAYGPLMTGQALWRCLGFPSANSFHHAAGRGLVPVESFRLSGRKGRFARSADVAAWLADQKVLDLNAFPSEVENKNSAKKKQVSSKT